MKIVLLGYMGSGKSSVAKTVAAELDIPVIDLDDFIVEKEQLSIKEIFKNKGEIYFRLKESEYLKELLQDEGQVVIALGGGTPCYADNMTLIKKMSTSFYLKGSISTLSNRLQSEKDQRPLIAALTDEQLIEFIAKHLFERRNFYEQANHTINIDHKSVETLSQEVLRLL